MNLNYSPFQADVLDISNKIASFKVKRNSAILQQSL